MANDIEVEKKISERKYEQPDNDSLPSFIGKKVSCWMLPIAAVALVVSGSYNSIGAKWMNKQKEFPSSNSLEKRFFEAPFFQTGTCYVLEAVFLLFVYIDKWINKEKHLKLALPQSLQSFNRPPCPKYLWLIPTIGDYVASLMANYAFMLAQVSTVQLLRNFNVVIVALFSLIVLRIALRVHQWMGVAAVTLGLVLTGIVAFMGPPQETNYPSLGWLGLVFAILGTVTMSFQFVFEERLFRKYSVQPLEALGCIGCWGLLISCIMLVILEFIGFEKTSETFYMMSLGTKESRTIIISNVLFIFSCAIFNASGMFVTKLGSGLLRTILIAGRTFSIWIIELAIGWSSFSIIDFMGLLVVLAGVGIYNYNYMVKADSWKYDRYFRRPFLCGGLVRSPDEETTAANKYSSGDDDMAAEDKSMNQEN